MEEKSHLMEYMVIIYNLLNFISEFSCFYKMIYN